MPFISFSNLMIMHHCFELFKSCAPISPYQTKISLRAANNVFIRSNPFSSYGSGLDQNDLMESDMLIAVDKNDYPISSLTLSKRKAHEFNSIQPRGIAHRAFSVFLFNNDNHMLITQRASTKITFPNVWTNACCSHPLYNMVPNEVDDPVLDYPSFPGIKHAAVRKLKHELGILPQDVPHHHFHFITRFHYWAADTVTYGEDSAPWGEHEIDYVLFIKCTNGPQLKLNPDEVSNHEYVSKEQLEELLMKNKQESNNPKNNRERLWSPWFCGIMERGGFDWWQKLDDMVAVDTTQNNTMGNDFSNRDITYFDPPQEHYARYNLPTHDKSTGVLQNP